MMTQWKDVMLRPLCTQWLEDEDSGKDFAISGRENDEVLRMEVEAQKVVAAIESKDWVGVYK